MTAVNDARNESAADANGRLDVTMVDDAAPVAGGSADQVEAIEFLASPAAHGLAATASVERHETHGALIFLAGNHAFKIKRALRYSYMDFSTLEKRKRVRERELEINRRNAPDLYFDVVALTRERNGVLALGGAGAPVEWALRMHRFEQASPLSHRVAAGLSTDLVKAHADVVSRMHGRAPIALAAGQSVRIGGIIRAVTSALSADREFVSTSDRIGAQAMVRLDAVAELLDLRNAAGKVRRCHGDLHLDKIVVWNGKPTLFDVIEFDEDIATIDTLYDLAFLLIEGTLVAIRLGGGRSGPRDATRHDGWPWHGTRQPKGASPAIGRLRITHDPGPATAPAPVTKSQTGVLDLPRSACTLGLRRVEFAVGSIERDQRRVVAALH